MIRSIIKNKKHKSFTLKVIVSTEEQAVELQKKHKCKIDVPKKKINIKILENIITILYSDYLVKPIRDIVILEGNIIKYNYKKPREKTLYNFVDFLEG